MFVLVWLAAALHATGQVDLQKGLVAYYPFNGNAYDEDLFFGKLDNQNYPYWFNGLLDEVRFYNRVLTKEEMTALCNQTN